MKKNSLTLYSNLKVNSGTTDGIVMKQTDLELPDRTTYGNEDSDMLELLKEYNDTSGDLVLDNTWFFNLISIYRIPGYTVKNLAPLMKVFDKNSAGLYNYSLAPGFSFNLGPRNVQNYTELTRLVDKYLDDPDKSDEFKQNLKVLVTNYMGRYGANENTKFIACKNDGLIGVDQTVDQLTLNNNYYSILDYTAIMNILQNIGFPISVLTDVRVLSVFNYLRLFDADLLQASKESDVDLDLSVVFNELPNDLGQALIKTSLCRTVFVPDLIGNTITSAEQLQELPVIGIDYFSLD